MAYGFLDIAGTPSVRAAQAEMASDHLWTEFKGDRAFDRFTQNEAEFIASRDSFYIASVSETGWPYVQHRGGTPGFLKNIDDQTLAFADYRGNRQYISRGNISANSRVCLFLMDYARRARLKIYAYADILLPDDDPALSMEAIGSGNRTKVERVVRLRLAAFDWNCPQFITPRFSEREIADGLSALHQRLASLEKENSTLRAQIQTATGGQS